jgi:hypothetical protein
MAASTPQVFQGVTLAEYGVLCQKAQARIAALMLEATGIEASECS